MIAEARDTTGPRGATRADLTREVTAMLNYPYDTTTCASCQHDVEVGYGG